MNLHKFLIRYLLRLPLPERENACLGLHLKSRKLSDLFYKSLNFWMSWCWLLVATVGSVFGFRMQGWTNEDKLMGLLLNILVGLFVYVSVSHLLLLASRKMDKVAQRLFLYWQCIKEMRSLESQRKTIIKNHD